MSGKGCLLFGIHKGRAGVSRDEKSCAAQDFIPPEEMARLLAQSGSETAKAQAAALEEQQRIQADNVGHRMLQAMGWKEGQGLGAGGKGMAAPVTAAGSTKAPYEKGGLGAAVSPALISCCGRSSGGTFCLL